MAHKKAAGTSKNNRDSQSKRRGVKMFGDQVCLAGNIIVRQKGTVYLPGDNTALGKDFTIYATEAGKVKFGEKRIRKYDGRVFRKTIVNVETAK
ncbi:MAG: 50S ribosomal protein L27 [Candidatus Gracilibacteria bacterium]|nr:50S ribosomal protein L27 [Candidatus Gracilibacteria bacterium]